MYWISVQVCTHKLVNYPKHQNERKWVVTDGAGSARWFEFLWNYQSPRICWHGFYFFLFFFFFFFVKCCPLMTNWSWQKVDANFGEQKSISKWKLCSAAEGRAGLPSCQPQRQMWGCSGHRHPVVTKALDISEKWCGRVKQYLLLIHATKKWSSSNCNGRHGVFLIRCSVTVHIRFYIQILFCSWDEYSFSIIFFYNWSCSSVVFRSVCLQPYLCDGFSHWQAKAI